MTMTSVENNVKNENRHSCDYETFSFGDFQEPPSMSLVYQEYGNMQRAINELGDKVSAVFHKQESDFLSSYRMHVRNMKKDFIDLKEEIEDKEKAIENNVKVKQLEKERDWYKKEALHLDQVLLKTKKKEHELREKVDELEEDRKWLSNQLKILMSHKNMLERQVFNNKNNTSGEDEIDDPKGSTLSKESDGLQVTNILTSREKELEKGI